MRVFVILSGTVVVAFGLCLVAFAILAAINRPNAERFLSLFASSAKAHFTEQITRVVIGTAIVIFSPTMWYPTVFTVFGWLIVVSSAVLLILPWRWHERIGDAAKPLLVRYLGFYAVGAFALGTFILYGASRYATQSQ